MSNLFGRKKIYTAASEITEQNIVEELNKVLPLHFKNKREEDYLYWYRRGKQPILEREKAIRPEINNKIVQNVADEIVAFKNGYFLTRPTFYVNRRGKSGMATKIKKLNEYLYLSGKAEADNNLVDMFHTMGIGCLFVEATGDKKTPVRTYAVDPRHAFVVYSCRPSGEPMFGVNMVIVDDDKIMFDVWTKTKIFLIEGSTNGSEPTKENSIIGSVATEIKSIEDNAIGGIPLIEYVYSRNRMGAFENVLDLCDAINQVQSDRENGVAQFIQSLMVLTNCTLGDDENGNPITAQTIRQSGLIELKSNSAEGGAKVDILAEQLDQTQTQVYIEDLMKNICDIAGVPFTSNTSAGTSDNVGAVYLRSGWASADCYARNTEDLFRESNKYFDDIFLNILRYATDLDMDASDVDIQFTRNEMDNLLVKTQGALNLKQLGYSPELCIAKSGLSNDPSGDYEKSKKYMDKAFSVDEPKVENNPNEGEENGTDNTESKEADTTGDNRNR